MSRAQINTDISRELDIVMRKGDTFVLDLQILDSASVGFNITNYTAKMSILKGRTQRPLTTLYSTNIESLGNYITMGDGFISMHIPSEITENWKEGEYIYDLQLTSPFLEGSTPRTTTWLKGKFIINPDITL